MHTFELVGGHPALDFLNTISDWTVESPRDFLADGHEAVRFGEQAGLLGRADVSQSPVSAAELAKLKALRTLLERVVQALLEERAPLPSDLEALDLLRTEVSRASRLAFLDGRLTSDVSVARAGGSTLRLRIAAGAIGLLHSAALPRIKRCPSCAWFFLDTSKNGSRRWCSMATCGATAKAHRYYWKDRDPPA